jgi:hypothetical protein
VKKAAVAIAALAVAVAAAALPSVRAAVKERSPWAIIATNVYQDGLRRVGLRSGQISDPYLAGHEASEIPTFLQRISNTYRNYMQFYGEQAPGGRVLEIGPGDNIGVALRFIADGADHVTVVDKFVPLQESAFHRQLYAALREQLPADAARRLGDAVDLSAGVQLNPERVTYVNKGIEEVGGLIPPASIHLVVSNAVLEEVFEIDRMFEALDRLMAPGGVQIHKIDLSDYGMFSKHGYHPLEFLTVRDGLYRYMVESTGQPNRRLVDYYRDKMRALGYSARIYASAVLGRSTELVPPVELPAGHLLASTDVAEQIRSIRPRLLDRYRRLPDEDLAVQGIVLVARKPVNHASVAPSD